MQNNFLMGVKFWTSWGVAPTIFKITLLRWLFSKMVSNLTILEGIFETKFQPQNRQVKHQFFKNPLQQGVFENFLGKTPTCLELYSHKKVVVHFFIPMLLLPKTPSLTYPNIKKFKRPKMDHFTSLHSLHSLTSLTSLTHSLHKVDSGDQRKF